jgi:hypothetical protein
MKPLDLVPRPTLVIADLHGMHKALEGNLRGADAIDENGDWKRSGADLVFLGDAIADRGRDDLEVVTTINRLREQVEATGGSCTTVAGNHDGEGLGFLVADPTSYRYATQSPTVATILRKQFAGFAAMSEAVSATRGDPDRTLEELRLQRVALLSPDGKDPFLGRFKMSSRGREVVKYLTGLKLFDVRGSSLFLHTPPTPGILRALIGDRETINPLFRKGVAAALKQEGIPELTGEEKEEWDKLAIVFLSADNRKAKVPEAKDPIWAKLSGQKIQSIFFGHDNESRGTWQDYSTVKLLGLDTWYGRSYAPTDQCAAAWLYPDHRVERFNRTI